MNPTKHRHDFSWRSAATGLIGVSMLVITGTGVLASLNATTSNATPQSVDSGTLALTMSDTKSSAGFSTSISNLAPGDVVNRYIDLRNSGTLDAQGLTLAIAATGTRSLITDGTAPVTTKALQVTVNSCSVAWDQTKGVCSGDAGTTQIAPTTLSKLAASQSLTTDSLKAEEELHLQVQVNLPDQDETTVDGVQPAATVQGGAVALTYTFFVGQRTATITDG
jgi:hypothetical protein